MAKNISKTLPQNEGHNLTLQSPEKTPATAQYLKGIKAIVIEQGLGKTRACILTKQLTRHGGVEANQLSEDVTHVLVGNNIKLTKVTDILKHEEISESVKVLRADWLSACLKEGVLVDYRAFSLRENDDSRYEAMSFKRPRKLCMDAINDFQCASIDDDIRSDMLLDCQIPTTSNDNNFQKRRKVAIDNGDSDYINSDDDSEEEYVNRRAEILPNISPHKKLLDSLSQQKIETQYLTWSIKKKLYQAHYVMGDKWICTKPSSSKPENLNHHITEKLEVLEKFYKNSNDQWRALGYKKAIASIKNFPKKIETLEECKNLPFVGERLANKIYEIIQTGHLQRLDHLDAKSDAMELFCNLWGAGPKTAESWVAKGLKSLDDLKEHVNLSRQQQIGLKYYDEFLERMPRSEAEEIGNVVMQAAQDIDSAMQCMVCGSFRRGKSTCGDVDVLVSHPDGHSHQGVMPLLLAKLKESGFLSDDLTLMDNQKQRKYLGVCLLPGKGHKHRRIDIIVVPYSEWACSLIYFTGSDYLNRSMRLLARKKGMSLSEHSLNTGVVRKGQERLTEGTPLPVLNEKDVFQYLGLDFLEPHERDW